MAQKILQSLGDELRSWRVKLTTMRDEHVHDVDELIDRIDDAIEALAILQARAAVAKVEN